MRQRQRRIAIVPPGERLEFALTQHHAASKAGDRLPTEQAPGTTFGAAAGFAPVAILVQGAILDSAELSIRQQRRQGERAGFLGQAVRFDGLG